MGLRVHLSQSFLPPPQALPAQLSWILGPEAFLRPESDSGNHSKCATEANHAGPVLSAWEWDWIDLGGEG
jgi:hypothetical protein